MISTLIATLNEDINSRCKGLENYGKKGDKVKVISTRGHVVIVEGKHRFPVHESKLTIKHATNGTE